MPPRRVGFTSKPHPMDSPQNPRIKPLPALIFSSRWLQLPLYLGLIVAQGVYVVLFVKELWHLIHGAMELNEQQVMLIVLAVNIDQRTAEILQHMNWTHHPVQVNPIPS